MQKDTYSLDHKNVKTLLVIFDHLMRNPTRSLNFVGIPKARTKPFGTSFGIAYLCRTRLGSLTADSLPADATILRCSHHQTHLQSSCSMSFVARNHQLSTQLHLSFEIDGICDFNPPFDPHGFIEPTGI